MTGSPEEVRGKCLLEIDSREVGKKTKRWHFVMLQFCLYIILHAKYISALGCTNLYRTIPCAHTQHTHTHTHTHTNTHKYTHTYKHTHTHTHANTFYKFAFYRHFIGNGLLCTTRVQYLLPLPPPLHRSMMRCSKMSLCR